ncbi:MAG: alpha/beta hydrolase [Alphaproteobacteria bacterium]|nr:alpha/beta hydrolase [Alphaproteobacteria bacterium]
MAEHMRTVIAAALIATGCAAAAAEPATINIVARGATVTTKTAAASVRTIEVHDVRSRGERTRLLIETVNNPAAVAILFAGGKGATRLSATGDIGWGKGNFLIRGRTLFLQNGITTAVFDAPTDKPYDLRGGFRGSAAHAADIGAAIAHLRAAFNKPVWLIGTSRGTNSAGSAAARLGTSGPDGIVLTASMLAWNKKGDHLFDYALGDITVPVLIGHHEEDECFVTPPGEVLELVSRLSNARIVKTFLYSGGIARGNPCHAAHYHGFNGIEETVIRDISNWIKAQSP